MLHVDKNSSFLKKVRHRFLDAPKQNRLAHLKKKKLLPGVKKRAQGQLLCRRNPVSPAANGEIKLRYRRTRARDSAPGGAACAHTVSRTHGVVVERCGAFPTFAFPRAANAEGRAREQLRRDNVRELLARPNSPARREYNAFLTTRHA